MLLMLVGGAAALVSYYVSVHGTARPFEHIATEGSWKEKLGAIFHLGRDRLVRRNLGGRIDLWRLVWGPIREKPLLGYGYRQFWSPSRTQEAIRTIGWGSRDSHSMYLDVLLNAGLVGLGLFLLVLVTATTHALGLPALEAVFLVTFFFIVALEGMFESGFLTPNFRSFSFFLLLFAIS
jgi:O-antigen ligase